MKYSNNTAVPTKGSWSDQKEKLKAKFTSLTDADFQFIGGKRDEMLERIQLKIGKTKAELQNIIAAL